MVGIWYIKLETLLFTSYATSLEICKEPGWNPNLAHKHCLEMVIISYSSIKMVSLGCLLAQKVAILSMFLLEFKQVMGETYEFTQARKCKTP
jgi:hypothetical protein